jgi:hypothetical protein
MLWDKQMYKYRCYKGLTVCGERELLGFEAAT